MKILRLELRAFGPFTNISLDFSGEGLHIVYGPNEAGKSSTLRALRALLYGIPERTQDNFLHDNARLRIGGLLRHSDGSELFCLRRKGRLKTLLDNDEKEMDDSLLRRYLGNVTAELFDRMFGLTHTDLVRGGKDIIAGGGDLGESLFSAGLGGSGFRQLLQGLEAEAEELFAPRGTRKVINSALNEIAAAKNAVRNLALQGRDWETHQEALAGASRKKQEIAEELLSLRRERNRLDRLLQALPFLSLYKEAMARRQEMGEVLILPADFAADRRTITESLSQGRSVLEKTQRQMAETKEELEAISVPEELLKHGETISRLYKRLGSHEKAMSDLPRLKGERTQLEANAVAILKELAPVLSFEEAERLRLTEAERQRIGEMGGRLQRLEEDLRAVRKSAGEVRKRLETDRGDEAPTKE
ncbi:MAG: AAA family ATPase, partial [Thermodesulfovibrionales bacterium]